MPWKVPSGAPVRRVVPRPPSLFIELGTQVHQPVELESMSGCGLPAYYITDVSLRVSSLLHLYPTSRVYIASVTHTSRRIPTLRLHITLEEVMDAVSISCIHHMKRCHACASDL